MNAPLVTLVTFVTGAPGVTGALAFTPPAEPAGTEVTGSGEGWVLVCPEAVLLGTARKSLPLLPLELRPLSPARMVKAVTVLRRLAKLNTPGLVARRLVLSEEATGGDGGGGGSSGE